MPVIKSSKKRVRQTVSKTARNMRLKRDIRLAFNMFEKTLAGGDTTAIANAQTKLNSLLDTASKKNVFHKNKVARRKSNISKMVKLNNAQTSSSKSENK